MQTLSKKLEKEVLTNCNTRLEKGLRQEFLQCAKETFQQYKVSRLPQVRRIMFESRREIIKQTLTELEKSKQEQ